MYTGADFQRNSIEIKARISIPILWERFYGDFPRHWNSCRCPWRKDGHPSFWVSPDGQKWLDRGSGDKGDIFDFYRKAAGCDSRQAFLDLLTMAGNRSGQALVGPSSFVGSSEPKKQYHPSLRMPCKDELAVVSKLRSISLEALQIAVDRGFLWTSDIKGFPAFMVTDESRKCYLARKLDGTSWDHGGKAHALPGSQASWPIGCREAQDFPAIALCEGLPDFLSAFGHAWASGVEAHIAPVCMSSAAVSIAKEALPAFAGKRVRIFTHADEAGNKASDRWTAQLISVADKVDCWQFGSDWIQTDGQPVTDLNDLLRIDYDCWEDNRLEIEAIMAF